LTFDSDTYNSYLTVNLTTIKENIEKIRKGIGENTSIMAVLKGNAYGMGLVPIADYLANECDIDAFACAHVHEAALLRKSGIDCEIFIMGGVPFHNIPVVVSLNIMTPAYSREYLTLLNSEAALQKKIVRVHIKVETGLNRIGVKPGIELDELCVFLKDLQNIEVCGAYTHFAESEAVDKAFTYFQLEQFKQGLNQIRHHGFSLPFIHAFNTAAVSWMRDTDITHIRIAGLIFGFDPCLAPVNGLDLVEVLEWNAFVTHVKTINPGETVGYNRAFIANSPTKVATISAGYGDGYARHLAAFLDAEVIVNGKRSKIIATCMDQMLIDVTGIAVKEGEIATLIGRNGDEYISVFELQRKMGQTYLAVASIIAERVKRIYKR